MRECHGKIKPSKYKITVDEQEKIKLEYFSHVPKKITYHLENRTMQGYAQRKRLKGNAKQWKVFGGHIEE